MKINEKKIHKKMVSLTDETSQNIIIGTSQTMSLHDVKYQYQILSINDFNIVNNVGYFNKKTDFRIGEENSIIFLDKNLKQLNIKTSEQKGNEYILYPIPSEFLQSNIEYIYEDYENFKKYEIPLTFEFGNIIINLIQDMSTLIKQDKNLTIMGFLNSDIFKEKINIYTKNEKILKLPLRIYTLFIHQHKTGFAINKNIIVNSNKDFCLGVLNGLRSHIFSNINIYSLTSILNYLGAMYSITRGDKDTRRLNYYLPEYLKNPAITNRYIKFKDDKKHIDDLINTMDSEIRDEIMGTDLWKKIITNKILVIKTKDLKFNLLPVEENRKELYDFTMQRADATNYTIPFGPLLKNSDGDILGVIGIFGKESLEEAKEFSPTSKEYYKTFDDGSLQNWISKDAILGLYNATKTFFSK